MKQIHNMISGPISRIINNSFTTGVFPELFKMAKVIPIHKKDSKLNVTNYRPISLLSNISKIFERVMHTRLYMFLEKFKSAFDRNIPQLMP